MSLLHVNGIGQRLCAQCSNDQIIHFVFVMNDGDYFVCDGCAKNIAYGQNHKKIEDFENWTPKDAWKRKIVELDPGDHLYIKTRHHTLRIFTVGDDSHQSTDIHLVADTREMETRKIQFTSKGPNDLEDTKFLCFSTVESGND
jgi:hypothetical protein